MTVGFRAEGTGDDGIQGFTNATGKSGVAGLHEANGNGLYGSSAQGDGIWGAGNANGKSGVVGMHGADGNGVYGESAQGDGITGVGRANGRSGIVGIHSANGNGVYGDSTQGDGITGVGRANGRSAVVGIHNANGNGIYGRSANGFAGWFDGKVMITDDVILRNADCAEEFDVAETEQVEPGTVMVIDQKGVLRQSEEAYDKKVAGVISGAGDYAPGIVLDRKESVAGRMPLALVGKVYCKVDAHYAPIEVGDLLTTSPTIGYAMKADDPFKAFGAVIGKALRPLEAGQALIPILIALQ